MQFVSRGCMHGGLTLLPVSHATFHYYNNVCIAALLSNELLYAETILYAARPGHNCHVYFIVPVMARILWVHLFYCQSSRGRKMHTCCCWWLGHNQTQQQQVLGCIGRIKVGAGAKYYGGIVMEVKMHAKLSMQNAHTMQMHSCTSSMRRTALAALIRQCQLSHFSSLELSTAP